MASFLHLWRKHSQNPEQPPLRGLIHRLDAGSTKKGELEENRGGNRDFDSTEKQHVSAYNPPVDDRLDTMPLKNAIDLRFRILPQKTPAWRRLSRSRSRKRSAKEQPLVSDKGHPPPIPSHTKFQLPLLLNISSECLQQQINDRMSSLEITASAYISDSESSGPNSVFEPQSTCSKKPSPASTVSIHDSASKDENALVGSTVDGSRPVSVPELVSVEYNTMSASISSIETKANNRLSKEMIENMRGVLHADSEPSLYEEEITSLSGPEQTSSRFLDEETSKRLSAAINEATAEVIQYTADLQKDIPPPIPPRSAKRNNIGLAISTESNSAMKIPPVPAIPVTDMLRSSRGSSRKRTSAWLDKQPQRSDSLTGSSSIFFSRHYTRPNKTWYTTHERFMEIFDEIPSIVAGARRENPKIYHMRKRRVLLEMGLTERDLIEGPGSERGKRIMKLLDGLDERLRKERREEARRSLLEGESAGPVKRPRSLCSVRAHCVNDVRWNGYIVAEQGTYGDWVARSRDGSIKGKGKGKAVALE